MINRYGQSFVLLGLFFLGACKEDFTHAAPRHESRHPPLPEKVRQELENRPQFKTLTDFEQSKFLEVKEPSLRQNWRMVSPLPNVQFALPDYLNFKAEHKTLNQKRYPESSSPITWERYSYVDTALSRHLEKHPEARGTEAGVTKVYFEIYKNLPLKQYLQKRLKEDPMVFGYLMANRVDKPGKGYYLKSGDMFTYHHEFLLDEGSDTYVFHVIGPLGAIPEKSRLTDREVEDIAFSLRLGQGKQE